MMHVEDCIVSGKAVSRISCVNSYSFGRKSTMRRALDIDAGGPLSAIQINGSINSGKSTVGRSLAALPSTARFIDGDDHDAAATLPGIDKWAVAIARSERHIEIANSWYLVVAYPINHGDFDRLLAACNRRSA